MDSITLRSRLIKLLQKSRKAVRLYSSLDPKELQAHEWKDVTTELMRELTDILENPNSKRLLQDIYGIRDRFYSDWRLSESELHISQKDLITAAEVGDFTKTLHLSDKLIRLKGRVQACHAAHHELADVLSRAKLVESHNPISETQGEVIQMHVKMDEDSRLAQDSKNQARVIPLRQKRYVSI